MVSANQNAISGSAQLSGLTEDVYVAHIRRYNIYCTWAMFTCCTDWGEMWREGVDLSTQISPHRCRVGQWSQKLKLYGISEYKRYALREFYEKFCGHVAPCGGFAQEVPEFNPRGGFSYILSAPLAAKPYAFLYYQTEPSGARASRATCGENFRCFCLSVVLITLPSRRLNMETLLIPLD